MRIKIGMVLCAILIGSLQRALAADAYLVRFSAGVFVAGTCNLLIWHDNVTFFNSGMSPVVVRIIGNSDGPALITTPDSFVVPANHTVSLDDVLGRAWIPASQLEHIDAQYILYVLHIDVPAGVSLQSNDEVYILNGCVGPPVFPESYGHVSLPVFDRLAKAGRAQVYLGTDLGVRASRTNVGIYNAGDQQATAHIELRRVCDDSVADMRTVVIPANRTVQIGGLMKGADTCGSQATYWMRYTVVEVDRPSLTFVTTIATDHVVVPGSPTIDVSVAHGRDF